MIAEQRELDESRDSNSGTLKGKLDLFLRRNFPEGSASASPDAVRRLLLQEAYDWCLNRGVRMRREDINSAIDSALKTSMGEWRGDSEGDDPRGRKLGDGGKAFCTKFGGFL